MSKYCEVCEKEIPENYQNLLCDEHYAKAEKENLRLEALAEEEKKEGRQTSEPIKETEATVLIPRPMPAAAAGPDPSIKDPNYTENPEADDKDQWITNLNLFTASNVLLWHPTRAMYTFIKDYCIQKIIAHPQYPKFIWKPTIVDVGCGIGVGTNILSQEADFIWGIDKNEKSVMFGKSAFERQKNGIYYSSQISFDVVDIVKDNRTFMKFDVVVAIEVIEHINDFRTFIQNLIIKFDNRKQGFETTEYFISTPNRNNKSMGKDKPKNPYHVREWTKSEGIEALKEYFHNIEVFNSAGVADNNSDSLHTPLLYKCGNSKI